MINITECVILAPQQCYYNWNPHNPTMQAAAQLMVAQLDAPPKATERVSPYSDTPFRASVALKFDAHLTL